MRIYQQYFMVSSAAQLILDECVAKGCNLHDLSDYVVIQINDTHPTMVIPELIRLLVERGLEMDEAIEVVTKSCAYTNHTILAEALEKWPIYYLKKAVPQLMPIIEVLDDKVRRKYHNQEVYIIDGEERVHMAHIDIHYSSSVNGVASLHTEILKNNELHHFYEIYPEKFNNKTNGITFRRWLLHCNPQLTELITSLIGDGFKKDATQLEKLLDYKNDEKVLYGKSYITEKIGDYSFIISADSFFQVNTLGMEKLYGVVKKYLEPNKNMSVLDLYCGTGTIGIYISDSVKEVSGVEINKSAVKDAIKNADLNDINNIKFVCSDVKDVIKKYKNIDAVIVDPPRAGLSKEAIENLINLNASKIVYVSCDAVTLARDINILKDFYDLIEITPVDMFPNTYHIECVSILKLKVLK